MAGYINNGTSRSLKITVNKVVGGNQVQGYPVTYDGQNSWGDVLYPTLTDDEFRQLSDGDFTSRYNAFVLYVQGIEGGLDFATDISGDAATKADANCLITTTTTAALTPALLRVDFYDSDGIYTADVVDASTLQMRAAVGALNTIYSVSINTLNTAAVGAENLIISSVSKVFDPQSKFNLTINGIPWTILPTNQNGFTLEFLGAAVAGTYHADLQIVHSASNKTSPFQITVEITVS